MRDATGNVMSTYEVVTDMQQKLMEYDVIERPMYGSSRLGMQNEQVNMLLAANVTSTGASYNLGSHQVGKCTYELSNHLGNVLSTITDQKLAIDIDADGTTNHYLPIVTTATDYYAFGAQMTERSFSSEAYRYGFNRMEKDNEVKGSGNSLDFGARIYDPRLGRLLSLDPLMDEYPQCSPFAFVGNSPIWIFLFVIWGKAQENNVFEIQLRDTTYKMNCIYNYFNGELCEPIYFMGYICLMPFDSLDVFGRNYYEVRETEDSLKIYFKECLVFEFQIVNGFVEGEGKCYYPFNNRVALRGSFKKSKLNGLTYVYDNNGAVIAGMRFRNNKYIKHEYFWIDYSFGELKNRSKLNRGVNPLLGLSPIAR